MNGQQGVQELMQKYKQKLQQQLDVEEVPTMQTSTREYRLFREEAMPGHMGFYEKACNFAGKLIKLKLKPEQQKKFQDALEVCHLNTTPEATYALSFTAPIAFMLISILASLLIFDSFFFAFFAMMAGIAGIAALLKYPYFLANGWRLKASNQMVLCIFYVATYMRHTSNLELAIAFAAEHLTPPLSLDLKKVLYDVEIGKYETVKESLELYLKSWKGYNDEFIEAFHLVESSLYEGSEDRRLGLLDKALDSILEQTYEKMLHYAQNLKSPITMLHMLGIVLPILGLVILPIAVSFMGEIRWWHLAALYNITLPIIVYLMGKNILSKRPTGYGDVDITEINPELKKYKNIILRLGSWELQINPIVVAAILGTTCFIIALTPVLVHWLNPSFDPNLLPGAEEDQKILKFLDYRPSKTPGREGELVGPFGLGASLLSLFFPLALAFSIGIYLRLRSKNVIKIREETKKLEDEFSGALFQLGNRLGDGIPAEIAFEKVAAVIPETATGRFFEIVTQNIRKLGMGVKEAIFNPKVGAIKYFPSNVIQSSMKMLIESLRKGPKIAANAVINVSRYIKEIHRVNERLKDLMADVISDMKSQISFLTPAIAGIVIGITSMITYILGSLQQRVKELGQGVEEAGRLGQFANFFGDSLPTYYFQLVVGTYVFQIIFILTILSNGIENGADKLGERHMLGRNLIKSTVMYCIMAMIVMLIFNIIAAVIIGRVQQG